MGINTFGIIKKITMPRERKGEDFGTRKMGRKGGMKVASPAYGTSNST